MSDELYYKQFVENLTTLDYMIKVLCMRDTNHCPDSYEILTQMFLILLTGQYSQPIVVYNSKVSFLNPKQDSNDLLLPLGSQSHFKDTYQIVYPDYRFISRNQGNLQNRKVLVDYVKHLNILPANIAVEDMNFEKKHWGSFFWEFLQMITLAADKFFNTFWSKQRGMSLSELEKSDEFKKSNGVADLMYNFLSRLLILSIPCNNCADHYKEISGDFSVLKNIIYNPRLTENWNLSDYIYQLHNIVNVSLRKPVFSLEAYTQQKKEVLAYIEFISTKSKDALSQTISTLDLNLKNSYDGTHINFFD